MGRRSDHTREEIRDMALTAAQSLLERDGPDAVTSRAIAQAIGYTAGTLYNIFADLEDLKLHVNARSLDLLHEQLAQARKRAASKADAEPLDVVMALARAQLRFIQQRPVLWQMLFLYSLPRERPVPEWFLSKVGDTIHELELAIAPVFGDDSAACRRHARMLWSAFYGLCEIASITKLSLIGMNEVEAMTRELVGASLAQAKERLAAE